MLCIYCMVKSYCLSCCPCCQQCQQNQNDMSVKVKLTDEPLWRSEVSTPMFKEQIDLIREAEFGRGMQAGMKSLHASLESLNHFNSSDLLSDATDLIDARMAKSKAKSMTHLAHGHSITRHTYENDEFQIPPPLPPRKNENKFHTLR